MKVTGRSIARNTLLNLTSLAIPIVIGIISIPITIRLLGLDRFAVLSLAWVVVGYFSFFDLGLGRSATKFIAELIGKKRLEKIPGVFWTAACAQFLLGIFGAVLLAILSSSLVRKYLNVPLGFQAEMISTLYILSFSLPIVLVSSSFRGALEAAQKFGYVNAVRVPASILNFVIPVFGGLLGMRLPGIMMLIVVSRAVAAAIWLIFDLRLFPELKTWIGISKEWVHPLLSFGGWVTVSSVIGPLLGLADRFLIGSILTLQMVSFYAPPLEMLTRVGIIPGSLILTLFPAFSCLGLDKFREESILFFCRSLKYLIISLSFIVGLIIFFSFDIIHIWLGSDFVTKSTPVLKILSVGFLMNSIAQVPFGFLQGMGRADLTAKIHIGEAFGYFPLLWLLISKWGINGAAAGWTIRVTVDLIMLLWASILIGKIKISYFIENRLIRSSWISFVFLVLAMPLLKNSWSTYLLFFVSVGYIVCQWAYSMSQEERRWFLQETRVLLHYRKDFRKGNL